MDEGTSIEEVTVSLDRTSFSPKSVTAGNDTIYDINLKMSSVGEFEVDAKMNIKNTSKDAWNELIFYFIPNIFTEQTLNKISHPLDNPGTLSVEEVAINGEKVEYDLEKDTLRVPLKSRLDSNGKINVGFKYNFTLPENGLRYTKNNGNYYLAQFYPMLATYREHRWNKEEYRFKGETFHTDFSDFNFTYQIPKGFTLTTTSPNDFYPNEKQGSLQANNVNMFFAAILNNPTLIEKEAGHTNIRVFGFGENMELYQEVTDIASDALTYFEENIGSYPHDQLDILLDGMSMEYPGIVTAYSIYNSEPLEPESLKKTVVHEIAHQWFYGIISNDPYHDAWLDEGFADFATELYFHSTNNEEVPYSSMYAAIQFLDSLPVNLPLHEYEESNQSSYIYGKSSVMLWKLFEERGGLKEAEKFLRTYYQYYQFKEINSKEFIRFTKHYFRLSDDSVFDEWLLVK
ncbi:M1 family metallopeptidase [Bacillus sp. CH30_1T]|uniref:M1 family metallopeptidase n=1 Tax=Bacillus sp. CH30_1T TaxID=2604836 RepID=UPI00165E3331|nr:M1 family metallopeptidase [Bacillus sp. CH30_1T]